MAAVHYPVVGPMMQPQPKEEGENPWTQMLAEIGSKPGSNDQGSVVFLGDEFCGKTSLLQRMTKKDRPSFSSALEYSFLNIQSDYKDDSYAYQLGSSGAAAFGPSDYVNLPVYLLNGRTEHAPLLKFAFPQHLNKCCIVLMASLIPPENILPSLEKWYKVIEEKINEIYDEKEIQAGKQAQIRFWQEYVEPLDTSMHNEHTSVELDPTLLPLESDVLTYNCGAPVVVVLSKCDQYNEFNDDQLNRIQYHVRNFCISRGAALFYTSAKDDRNTHLLYKYLAHRVYNLSFTTPAYIVERDSVFIPSGWDSLQKLEIHSLTPQAASVAAPQDAASPIMSFFGNLMKSQSKTSSSSTSTVDPSAHFQKILNNSKPKKASTAGLGGDQSPRAGLTANSSASALSDQDMDDNESVKSGDPNSTATTDYGSESQPNSARD
uniref:Dynein light intermediate chain n=1 Tax=Panagrolaimus sp. ES5 TaxID=591445 RepID=A0AC34FVL1_9BILA